MKKIVLVFCGLPGSGKDGAAAYLQEKYHASHYSFSTMLEDVLRRFYLEFNRDNLVKISEMIRATFGEDIMAKTMAKDVEKDPNNLIVVSNARRPADISRLSKLSGFVLISINTELEARYERLIKRGQRTDDKTKTFEQFKADHQRSTEVSILDLAKNATEQIDNNGSLEDLYIQLDALIQKYAGSN